MTWCGDSHDDDDNTQVGCGGWREVGGSVGGGVKTACQTLTFLAHPEVKALVEVHEVAGQRSSGDRQVHRLRLYYLHTASTQRHHRGTGTTLSQSRHSHRHDTLTLTGTTLSQARHSHRHDTLNPHNALSHNSHRHNTTLSQPQHCHSHNTLSLTTLTVTCKNTVSGKDRQWN